MTARVYAPRPNNTIITNHLLDTPRGAAWAGMGMGKTVSTATALSCLELTEPGPALVLAPYRVATSTWPDEFAKWEHLHDMPVVPVIGTAEQRRAALRKPGAVYTMNYENLPWLVEHLRANRKRWPFGKVVADESTRLKSFRLRQGGARARALGEVAHTMASHFWELNGTPSPNGLQDLWGQAWFMDAGERLGRSFEAFKSRWFQSIQVGDQRAASRLEPLPFAQEQITERLQDICISLDARDYFNIDEPIHNVLRVELPAKARKLYQSMEREMFLALDNGTEVEAFNAASKTIKCLQLASGAIYTDDKGGWAEVHDAKLQALESVVEEAAGAPVLVGYHFKSDLARLLKAFPQGRHLDKNPRTVADWNAGKIPLLFAHPQSAGHGLNLQDGGNILVMFSHWWALEEYLQIIERIGPTRQAQAGHPRPVFIHHIV
ncbi:MAG TPA: SNF2-related protein, partial [Burkholderiaceae bacterium]